MRSAETLHSAEAGHWGKEVRSDLHVSIETRESGGLEISLESRVAPYYGSSIMEQTREVLAALEVKHAGVVIRDEGALPYTIGARIEAAARRAGIGIGKRWLPESHYLPAPSLKERLRRSRLYLPGSEPKYFINAGLHGPDAVILDLEDSVHRDEKDAARILVRNTLRVVDFGTCERMVRINQLPLGLEDLEELVGESPDLILIPKVERPEQVVEADRTILEIKSRNRITRSVWIMPILESALGIENAFAIATASENVAALTIGLEDYTADLGVAKTAEGRESQYAQGPRRKRCASGGDASDRFGIRRCWGYGRIASLGRGIARHGVRGNGMHSSRTDSGDPRSVSTDCGRDRKSAEDRGGVRRSAEKRIGRGQPGFQDD